VDQHARRCVSAKSDEGLATEVSEVSSHRASRVEQAHARDRKPQGRRHEDRVRGDEAEAVSGVVKTPGPSVMPRDDHGSSRASRVAKVTRENRERTARGCTSIVRMAEVGWTHRASSASGVRKGSWSERALAGRKPEALPDAGHGWREGESVRGSAIFPKRSIAQPACR
jgi:hypothetical protein